MARFSLSTQYATDEDEPPPRWRARALVAAALRFSQATDGAEIAIRFVGEAESAALNRRWRGKRGATNVLSFSYRLAPVAGDIAVCGAVTRAEAARWRLRIADRYAHVILHGVLHLLGYGHETPTAAARMEEAERRILARFGVSDPYLEGIA